MFNKKLISKVTLLSLGSLVAGLNTKKAPNFGLFENGLSEDSMSKPFLVHVNSLAEFNITQNLFPSQGPIHVYVNAGATNQSVFLEGFIEGWGYTPVPLTTSESQIRPEIKPGEALVEGNTEKFWDQGTSYSRRDIVQMGCNKNGTDCITEQWRHNTGDIYNVFEGTYHPVNNGHVHAGGAHLDHSLVDGYTIPMIVIPDSDTCGAMGCTEDPAGAMCPADHKIAIGQDPTYTGCASDCKLHDTDEACCRGVHNVNTCKASSKHFSNYCTGSYAYAYDDRKGLRFCAKTPEVIYHLFDVQPDCEWAATDPKTQRPSAEAKECLKDLIGGL